MSTTAYIGLGSNLGNRAGCIKSALEALGRAPDVKVTRISKIIETAPLIDRNQHDYLNAVAEINTTISAEDLHKTLTHIETSLGRQRKAKWSPRNIDLDLLLFGQELINRPDLTVPHPQMHIRSFVLEGLCQLNAELLHPVIKKSVNELATRLGGASFALNPNLPQLISVAGVIGVGKTTLTELLSNFFGIEPLLEPYDTNPFLPDVYAGRKEMALDSQLYFLLHRTEQLNRNALAKGLLAMTDYIFDKELIYARRLLNARQLALYEEICRPSSSKIAAPVLVIYLQDSVARCLERIHRRNRPYEQAIEPQFLEKLNSDYEQLFSNWKTSPVIRILISEFDYMQDGNIQHLANQIRSYIATTE